jgi:hypothetical protein
MKRKMDATCNPFSMLVHVFLSLESCTCPRSSQNNLKKKILVGILDIVCCFQRRRGRCAAQREAQKLARLARRWRGRIRLGSGHLSVIGGPPDVSCVPRRESNGSHLSFAPRADEMTDGTGESGANGSQKPILEGSLPPSLPPCRDVLGGVHFSPSSFLSSCFFSA